MMSETVPSGDWFGDPADSDVAGEFVPQAGADPEEPESIADDEAALHDTGEANVADVVDQQTVVRHDEDAYQRDE